MTTYLTTRDRFEGWTCVDDAASMADELDPDTAAYWDDEAERMGAVANAYAKEGRHSMASLFRAHVQRAKAIADKLRKQEAEQ